MNVSCKTLIIGSLYDFLELSEVPTYEWDLKMEQFILNLNVLQLLVCVNSSFVDNFECFKIHERVKSIIFQVDLNQSDEMNYETSAHKIIADLLLANEHITSIKVSNLKAYKTYYMQTLGNALRLLPKIDFLEFDNCFHDLASYAINESVFMALNDRSLPIRHLSML